MSNQIQTGALLIAEGTLVPDSLLLELEPYSIGWESLKSPAGREMDRELAKAGWSFFFLAGEINRSVLGFDVQKATRTAVIRLLSSVKSRRLNCLEIRRVVKKSLIGVHFVSVFAHPRQIQRSSALAAPVGLSKKARPVTTYGHMFLASWRRLFRLFIKNEPVRRDSEQNGTLRGDSLGGLQIV